ncbi:MAG: hypothetical protein GPJ54_19680 [Candidatus Heimdallarchaeota archaeon]|nr:hypothetical protein [Candidatus Heimdallarchaeota archaeon]
MSTTVVKSPNNNFEFKDIIADTFKDYLYEKLDRIDFSRLMSKREFISDNVKIESMEDNVFQKLVDMYSQTLSIPVNEILSDFSTYYRKMKEIFRKNMVNNEK